MRVKVISAFCLGGGVDVFEGQVIDMPDAEANVKIQQGFVVATEDKPSGKAAKTPGSQGAAPPHEPAGHKPNP